MPTMLDLDNLHSHVATPAVEVKYEKYLSSIQKTCIICGI
jgi:hypothetical protein